jgi:hypothetical protein
MSQLMCSPQDVLLKQVQDLQLDEMHRLRPRIAEKLKCHRSDRAETI